MQRWIAILRGVNVGGHRKLPMAEFRGTLSGLGFEGVATYIQSGNAVFRAPGPASELAEKIGAAIARDFGFKTDVVVIAADTLEKALAENPFKQAEAAPTTLHLFLPAGDIGRLDEPAMKGLATSGEEFAILDNVFYLHTPNGFGRSGLAAKIDRFFNVPVTARNLRSCRKILDLAQQDASG